MSYLDKIPTVEWAKAYKKNYEAIASERDVTDAPIARHLYTLAQAILSDRDEDGEKKLGYVPPETHAVMSGLWWYHQFQKELMVEFDTHDAHRIPEGVMAAARRAAGIEEEK